MPLVWTFCRFSRHFKHPQISIFHSSIFYQFAALSIFQYLLEPSPLDDDIAQWCSNIKSQNRFQFERIKVAALQILPKWSNAHWVVRNCGSNLTLGPSDWVSQFHNQFPSLPTSFITRNGRSLSVPMSPALLLATSTEILTEKFLVNLKWASFSESRSVYQQTAEKLVTFETDKVDYKRHLILGSKTKV